jgi:hypothetical protein
MNKMQAVRRTAMSIILAVGISVLFVGNALAHCDTISGPIIPQVAR